MQIELKYTGANWTKRAIRIELNVPVYHDIDIQQQKSDD